MTGKRIDDMDKAERREVGEKLYSGTKDAYTAGGTLIATIDGNILSLGTFSEGTFDITPDGKKVAIEQGLLPEEPKAEEPDLSAKGVAEQQAGYGTPETPATEALPGALPSDVPVRDPEPHPPQPIAATPNAISHRGTDPDGEPVEGGEPPPGEGLGQPEVDTAPITASTLPEMQFSQPPPPPPEPVEGEEPAEPEEPVIVKRGIAKSFPSPGGGTPDHPVVPVPGGEQPEPPDPNAPPPDVIDNELPDPEVQESASRKGKQKDKGAFGLSTEQQPGVGQRPKDAAGGKDDKSDKPKGSTQGRQLKLNLHDTVKATSKAKTD